MPTHLETQDIQLPEELLTALQNEVVPIVIETSRVVQDVYDLDPENNGNSVTGATAWGNLYNRLKKGLDKSKWEVRHGNNDLRFRYKGISQTYNFRIHRCDPETRIPTGGRSAKKDACDPTRNMLSEKIMKCFIRAASLVITYDIDPLIGLGSITVVYLIGNKPADVIAFPVATLYEAERLELVDRGERPAQEVLPPAVPTRGPARDAKKAPRKARKDDGQPPSSR